MFKSIRKGWPVITKLPPKPCPNCGKNMAQRQSSMGITWICPMCGFSEDSR